MAESRIKYNNLSNTKNHDLNQTYNIRVWQQCGYRCAKTFVIIFNIVFWLFGWTLVGIGLSLRSRRLNMDSQLGEYSTMSEDGQSYSSAAELCLSVGCITVIVVLLACCGSHTENRCIFGSYIGAVVVILCFEIGAIVVTGLYREKVEQRIIRDIKFTMNVYEQPNFEAITNSIDSFQKAFDCCGCNSYQDWYNSTWGKLHQESVPSSCLRNGNDFAALQMNNKNTSMSFIDINTKGCFEHVRKYFVKNLYFFGTFVIWVIGVQLVGLAFSACLFHKMKKHRTTEIVCRYQRIATSTMSEQ